MMRLKAWAGISLAAGLTMLLALACGGLDTGPPAAVQLTRPPVMETTAPSTATLAAAPAASPANTERRAATASPASAAAEAQARAVDQQPTGAAAQVADAELIADQVAAAQDMVMSGIYERTLPSIVGLRVTTSVSVGDNAPRIMPSDFFSRAAGSGFVWDDRGHIVTNRHVVTGTDRIVVVLSDGVQTEARIVGEDADSDLAVIRIADDAIRPPPVPLGDSDTINPGQLAVAIGDPFSRGFSMTSGIISAVGRTINPSDSNFSVPRVIQHDAATNPGNSGGPLLNRSGEVIGINTQIISETGVFSGVGLAIPVNLARLVVPALIEDGRYEYPYIGIRGTTVTPDIARAMKLPPETRGALVIAVGADSAAERAGLQASDQTTVVQGVELPIGGDVITAINDAPILGMDDVIAYVIEHTRPGDTARFTVLRDSATELLNITLDGRPE